MSNNTPFAYKQVAPLARKLRDDYEYVLVQIQPKNVGGSVYFEVISGYSQFIDLCRGLKPATRVCVFPLKTCMYYSMICSEPEYGPSKTGIQIKPIFEGRVYENE